MGTGVEIRSDKIPVTLGGILLPDYNRNGQIDDEDAKLAISQDSYHFWINDDNDEGETEGDDIPGNSSPNSEDSNVNGVRDLVDFFPVFIDLKRYMTTMVGGPYKYFIRTNLGSMNFAYAPQLIREKSGNYLTDVDTARDLGEVKTYIITPEGIELDTAFIDKILGTEGAGIILVEGRNAAKDSLILDIVDSGGTTVFSYRLNVGLADVEQMFRHKNLTANGVITIEPDAEDPSNLLPGKAPENGEPDRLGEPTNFPDNEAGDPLNEQNFVFVHGYNVNGQQARGWHAEMFKRMYWSGSKAKFWGVTWYGWRTQQYYPIYGYRTSHYRLNVRQAFNTAGEFKNFVANVGNNVTIAAHSLGNMVVLSAIQDHGLTNFARYYMINAAVALEALDAATPTSTDMDHIDWDGYDPQLFASEWYRLFLDDTPQDERAKLTWRDRFKDIPFEKIYNFYSSSDEVFEPHPHDDVPGTEDVTLFDLTMIGRQTWALQEKLKGRNVSFDVGNVNGGWGFNLDDYYKEVLDMSAPDPNSVPKVHEKLNPEETGFLLQEPQSLRIAPFFLKHKDDGLLYMEESGSNYAKLHRDRLLAEAFPARTGAIGRNNITKLDNNNIDMPLKFSNSLPLDRSDHYWLHCDFKARAYVYVFGLYKAFYLMGVTNE